MATGTPPNPDSTPSSETDNWESASIEAPRQKAGDVIAHESFEADERGGHTPPPDAEQQADDAESVARRQTPTDDSAVESA